MSSAFEVGYLNRQPQRFANRKCGKRLAKNWLSFD